MANALGWEPISVPDHGEPEREARLREFTVFDADLRNSDGPIMVVDGVGHNLDRLIAFATSDDALGGWLPVPGGMPVITVEPGFWAYSRRIKNCERYGSFCDDEGDWHRHLIQTNNGEPVTLVSLALYTNSVDHPIDMDEYAASQGWGQRA